MQVSVENISKLERRMQVQVPAAQVTEAIDAKLKNLSRTARLKGFRPGKAPIKVIRQQFGPQVHREVIGELLQSSYSQAVTQNQLAPVGDPRIEPQSCLKDALASPRQRSIRVPGTIQNPPSESST